MLKVLQLQFFTRNLLILCFFHVLLVVELVKLEAFNLLLGIFTCFSQLSISPFIFQSALPLFFVLFADGFIFTLAFDLTLSEVLSNFELLAVVVSLDLEDDQSSTDLHADVGVWKYLDAATCKRQCSKLRARVLKHELSILILNIAMIPWNWDITDLQIAILTSSELVSSLHRNLVYVLFRVEDVDHSGMFAFESDWLQDHVVWLDPR